MSRRDQVASGIASISRYRLLAICLAVGIVSLVVASRAEERFREVSDGAILEISTIEALNGRQLLGPYSRFGWNHPGPLYFYLQAPWYLASGMHTAGMQAGALAINLAALGIIAFLCVQRLRPSLGASVSLFMALYVIRVPDLLVSAWNPHVIILPMIAVTLLLGVFAETGQRSLLYGAIAGSSFIVQTHIAMAPLVAALGIMACVAQRRAVSASAWRLTGLGVALWAPVLLEQATRHPGNLFRLVTFFTRDAPPGQRFGEAITAWATELTRFGAGHVTLAMGYDFHPVVMPWRLAGALCELSILAALAVRSRRIRPDADRWVIATAWLASLVALAAVSRVSGQLVDHEVFWISAIGALNAAVIVGAICQIASDRWQLAASTLAAIRWYAVLATLVLSVYLGASGMRDVLHRPRTLDDHAVDVITERIQRAMSELQSHRPLFRMESGIRPIAVGSLLRLHRGHLRFAVDAEWVHMIGESFRPNGGEDSVITISGTAAAPRVIATRRRPQ
ncbi:MAG: hypothetical protein ABI868_02140 [Acidobacteriota bacterium]